MVFLSRDLLFRQHFLGPIFPYPEIKQNKQQCKFRFYILDKSFYRQGGQGGHGGQDGHGGQGGQGGPGGPGGLGGQGGQP